MCAFTYETEVINLFQKKDIRINRTKEFVFEALKLLLKKLDYHDITISMIIKKAGIGRATFYRYYYTKDDIINEKLNSLTQELLEKMKATFDLTVYDKDIQRKVKFFFQFWDEHPDIINLIIHLDKTQILYNTWSNTLLQMFSTIEMGLSSKLSKDYIAHFATGGLTSILIAWFKNNRKESVDFIASHFYVPNT